MKVAELIQKLAELPQDADLTFIASEENGKDGRRFLYRDASFGEIMFELEPNEAVQIATILVKLGEELDPDADDPTPSAGCASASRPASD